MADGEDDDDEEILCCEVCDVDETTGEITGDGAAGGGSSSSSVAFSAKSGAGFGNFGRMSNIPQAASGNGITSNEAGESENKSSTSNMTSLIGRSFCDCGRPHVKRKRKGKQGGGLDNAFAIHHEPINDTVTKYIKKHTSKSALRELVAPVMEHCAQVFDNVKERGKEV